MADDGMLLNFELPTDAFTQKSKITGGSWKDRLTARKSAEYGRKKAQERAAGIHTGRSLPKFREVGADEEELINGSTERPAKRAKTNNKATFKPRGAGHGPGHKHRESKPLPKLGNGEIVSSLFTFNQEASAKVEEPTEDEIPIEPSNAPINDELATFTNLGLSTSIANHLLNKLEIKAPTAIQRKAVEQLCAKDSDAFIQAETGSGKTLAYLLPVVQRISQISTQMKAAGQDFNRETGLFAIVLAPTRELSKQISTVLDGLLNCCHWIVGGTVIGGEKKKSEKARLRKGLNILVATPGRLADHIDNTEVLDVSKVRWLILDEGDRLMELGFEQDIQKLVSVLNLRSRKKQDTLVPGLPERRTTILCSATIKANVEQLRSIALKDAVSISVDPTEAKDVAEQEFSAPAQLRQSYAIVPPKQRLATLLAVLKQSFKRKGSVMKCIVFLSCADTVDFHFDIFTQGALSSNSSTTPLPTTKLSKTSHIPQGNTIPESHTQSPSPSISHPENPVTLFRLHGSLQQTTRTNTLKSFSKATTPSILICTDVAARGLDLPNVDLVIEYDPPFSKDDHLHRIGRTARAGKDGRAMIFLMPGCEEGYTSILKEGKPRNLTRHDADELLKKGFAPLSGVVAGKQWEDEATEWQLEVERWVQESPKHLEQARRAFQSHVRAYATHVAAERGIFDLKQVHLGHLAKAFALRDKPGSIRVPGQRPGKVEGKKVKDGRRAAAGKTGAKMSGGRLEELDVPEMTNEQEAKRKMRAKMRAMGGASEFNLG